MIPVVRQNISPAAGAWNDVDLTAIFGADAGNVAGVVLEIVNAAGVPAFGVRKNGSGDVLTGLMSTTGTSYHTWFYIGVDANDIFECFIANVSISVWIVGYILNTEGTFLTNMVNKTVAPNILWTDIDISLDTAAETAICAFFIIDNALGGNLRCAFRENGSGDGRLKYQRNHTIHGAAMAVDAGEICEGFKTNANISMFLIGWLTANFTSTGPNAQDYSAAGVLAWLQVDMSADIPAGGNGAFLQFYEPLTQLRAGGIRAFGAGYNNYHGMGMGAYLWVEIDAGRSAEQQVANLDLDLWLWGYTNAPAPANVAPTAPTGQQVDGQSAPTGANCISDLTPGFTAIFNDPDAGDTSNAFGIQVGTASGLFDMWNSGWLVDATIQGNRCAAKAYAGAVLSAGTSYWWRCRFRDDDNAVGIWSAWQRFDMCEGVPEGIGLQCIPGGPLPHRRPFTCAVRVPLLEPGRRFPFEFPALQFPCH